jgi:hypothetical protein
MVPGGGNKSGVLPRVVKLLDPGLERLTVLILGYKGQFALCVLPVATVESLDDHLTKSVSTPRFTAALLCAFAALAAILGIIGVYGFVSCRVRWQMRELAVRQALGAQPGDVIRLCSGRVGNDCGWNCGRTCRIARSGPRAYRHAL